ncbi:uncharacterized protein LOC122978853 isoform X2 [Thunnus albacares]|uniref:uncharacterized protein LOC122978853 isoform X2 n=1 Tax=Thunnus albacares TaxID=8236 RepID=UPI001CF66898|nr:uncharacterized protein LOC122978853 isoform X2 [Thunnus albacares]
MEVAFCAKEVSGHATSMLASLSLQREQAQFCDCVVRQRQSPGQLYPAHRCVLAASSPVLASILSSTGALVELQAPCLSDSVLELLLDYIYTGVLPYPCSQRKYSNLLSAARHLQMDELQEALEAWQQTEVNDTAKPKASTGAEKEGRSTCRSGNINCANCSSGNNTSTLSNASVCCRISESTINTVNCIQVTNLIPQDLVQHMPCSSEVQDVSRVDKEGQKDQFHSAGTLELQTWQKSKEEELMEERRNLYLPCTDEVQEEERRRGEQTQQLCLTVRHKAEEEQTNRKEENKTKNHHSPLRLLSTSFLPVCTSQKDSGSPSQCASLSSSPSSLCCGAVPVICHSSRAAMLQLAEVSTMPPYPGYQASASSCSRAPVSRSTSTDNDSIVEGITTKHKNRYGAQNQDYTKNKDHFATQSWDYKVSSDQCTIQDLCKSSTVQSDVLKQDYSSSNTDHFITQNDEHMGDGLSHVTDHNDHHVRCDSFQSDNNKKRHRDDSVLLSCDDFPSKHQRLECTYSHDASLATAAKEQSIHSQDPRTLVTLPVDDSDTGSDSLFEDLSPKGEAKKEHSYSSWCTDEIDGQDSHFNLYGPKTDWYPNSHRAEKITKDTASWQHEKDSDYSDTAMTDKRHSADVCLPASASPESSWDNASDCHTSRELEKISDTEIAEPHIAFTKPVDSSMSDPTYSVAGQSYHGHLHYHCLSQEDTYFTHRDSDHNHSNPGHPVHLNCDHSDQSSDEDEAGTFASPGHSRQRKHFATGTTDQVLLLDISNKPAELLVSYKHRPGEGEKGVGKQDTNGTEVGNNDREQQSETTFVAGVGKGEIGVQFETDSFDEAKTKFGVREINIKERKAVGKDQSRPGAEVIHKAGSLDIEEVSSAREGEKTSTLTVCTTPSVSDSVQASMSSTLSVCIPSTLSASMPTNISAHLSTPVHHPFQCSLCDRSFSQRGSLNRHVRSHLGVRPFPCPRCPMTFSRQYRVTEHMRVHERCAPGNDFQKHPAS